MNWIQSNGVSLRYDLREGGPRTVVLIHEMGGSLESWDPLWARLAGHTLLRYDTRGAGLSEKITGQCSIDQHVDDLAGLLAGLGIDGPVALAGVAVGAAIAIRFAVRLPGKVSHLVAMAPACGVAAEAREGVLARAQAIREQGMTVVVDPLLERTWPANLRKPAEVFERFRHRWLGADPHGFAAVFSMLANMNLDADIATLPARTVLVGGEFDQLRPPAEIQRLAALAPGIETLSLRSGHFMPLQSPRTVAALLEGFIGTELAAAEILDAARTLLGSGGQSGGEP